MSERPRVLIEDWLPAAAIGVECMRERGSASALAPHTYRLGLEKGVAEYDRAQRPQVYPRPLAPGLRLRNGGMAAGPRA